MSEVLQAPEYLSPSSVSTFKQCPLKFKFSRIDKMLEPPTEATLRGNFVHDVLEALYSLQPEQRTLDVAKELSRSLWEEVWRPQVVDLIPGEADLRTFRWSSWWCVENLWKLENPSAVTPEGIEREVLVTVSGVSIRGFIDRFSRLDDGLVVTDYKTGKTPHPRFSQDKFAQLLIYAVALRELGVGDTHKVELLFLKDSQRLEATVTEEALQETVDTLVNTKAAILARCEAGEFEPNVTRLCDWCHFKRICPAWKR